jgi:acyl phosphate:glycerol-3-phosphate acyltransferase
MTWNDATGAMLSLATSTTVRVAVALCTGYLLGSVPVAVLVGRRSNIDPRDVGDRNPGYWNMRERVGARSAVPVFIGDALKGSLAAIVGRALGGPWWLGYVAAGAVMVGHAWPVFAGFRGGRSVLAFAGAVVVLAPLPSAIAIGALAAVRLVTRRFDWAARVGVFGYPVVQAIFEPRARVACTGLLMTFIGVRFTQAALSARRTSGPAMCAPDEGSTA